MNYFFTLLSTSFLDPVIFFSSWSAAALIGFVFTSAPIFF